MRREVMNEYKTEKYMKKQQTEKEPLDSKGNTAAGKEAEAQSANVAETKDDTVAEKPSGEEAMAELQDRYVRLQAEFQNYRKRTLAEKMALVETASEDVIRAILPVLDDMERAVRASEKADDIQAVAEGERLIVQKFASILQSKGLKEIEVSAGAEFDEERHDAVTRFAAGEELKGKVVDVTEKGYMLGTKVIRFAKVVIGE